MSIKLYYAFCGGKMVIFPENLLIKKCVFMFFDATLSPSRSDDALKRTAVDGQPKFGEEAAETLQNNFYVDDFLKSADDEDKAIKLLKEVKAMCALSSF